MAFIPEATDKNVGVGVSMYHAQIVIDAFNNALKDNNCMSTFPVAMYVEAEQHINRAEDIGVASGGTIDEVNPGAVRPVIENELTRGTTRTTPQLMHSLSNSVKNRYQNECIDCGWDDFPEFDIGDFFDDMLDDIKEFIENFLSLGDGFDTSMCHFIYLLSYVCIPDLIKLLALLLGYIMKLLTPINLGLGAIMAFIMGIIGTLIGMLMSYIMSVVSWAIGPIGCILRSLSEILASMPSADRFKSEFSGQQKQFLYDVSKGGINLDAGQSTILTPASNYLNGLNKNLYAATGQFGQFMYGVEQDIMSAVESILSTIAQFGGVFDWITCENSRSGLTIMEHIDAAMRITQLVNLIRAVIEQKGNLEAVQEMCNPTDSYPTYLTFSNGFSNDDIATVIENAFDVQAEIIQDGNDIGVLLTPRTKPAISLDEPTKKIELFSCNMNDFIRDAHLDKIVETSVQFAENQLKGVGKVPSALNIPRRPIDGLTEAERARIILFADQGTETDLKEVIDEIITFNRKTQPRRVNKPDNSKIYNAIPAQINDTNNTNNTNSKPQFKPFTSVNEGLSNTINKPIQLKCGTIDNLRDSLNNILGANT